jgi:hypothetical protein
MAKKVEKEEFPKVFITEDGVEVTALNEIQAIAFENEGLKEQE